MESGDLEIRTALHTKKLRDHHSCPHTHVINELGVAHGKQRIDIAVINGTIHGYEIKSSKDNLKRLPAQLLAFSSCFERLSIVTAPNHLEGVLELSPEWCEIIVVKKGKRGAIHFSNIRRGRKNPEICLIAVLHFLWKKEALGFLNHLGKKNESNNNMSRARLYSKISEIATFEDTLNWIKFSINNRNNWRPGEQL